MDFSIGNTKQACKTNYLEMHINLDLPEYPDGKADPGKEEKNISGVI